MAAIFLSVYGTNRESKSVNPHCSIPVWEQAEFKALLYETIDK